MPAGARTDAIRSIRSILSKAFLCVSASLRENEFGASVLYRDRRGDGPDGSTYQVGGADPLDAGGTPL